MKKQDKTRRRALKGALYGGPAIWTAPLISSVVLPVHAQTTEVTASVTTTTSTTPAPRLFSIGDDGPCGGKVYEVSNGGLNGKEAARADLPGISIPETYTWDAAITAAANYMGGGCTGWYLPDRDEIRVLYDQRDMVGGFAPDFYWSSSQDGSFDAWLQNFINGNQFFSLNKSNAFRGRAVRAF